MTPAGPPSAPLPPTNEAIIGAILAFDAGNHAWGRYRHFVLSALPQALPVSMAPVLEALREAAISVPDAQAGDPGPFLVALRAALAGMTNYRTNLPASIQLSEIHEAIGDVEEAIALLEGRLLPES